MGGSGAAPEQAARDKPLAEGRRSEGGGRGGSAPSFQESEKMQYQVFAVSVHGNSTQVEEMNRFLRSHRVLTVERQLVEEGQNSFWTFCVEFLETAGPAEGRNEGRIDYKEVLSAPEFERFARLRLLRKELAEKEGVPAYAIFTNEQLAQMVRLGKPSLSTMEGINGIGEAKTRKYGELFLGALGQPAEKNPVPQ